MSSLALLAADVNVAQNVGFYIIAAMMLFAAFAVVSTKNVVHAALWLVVVLGGVAAQYILAAAEFVKLSSRFTAAITVEKDGLEVNGKSIMGVMMLAAECGSTLKIRAEGQDAREAVRELATLVGNRFGETESDYEVED